MRSVLFILLGAMAVATIVVACSGGGDSPGNETAVPSATELLSGPTATLPPAPTNNPPPGLRGFIFPVAGGCLPESDDLMPGAPREYRDGTHEGVDFYDSDNCVEMGEGTEILAAKGGTVIRVDLDYEDLTQEELDELLALVAAGQGSDLVVQDRFRGRQVWIDHGGGVETRYAHLGRIGEIFVGNIVEQGDVIAFMGESGSPDSLADPGSQVHLHWELRALGGYVGQLRPVNEVRQRYIEAFSP